jgi:hypothetical protein
MSMHIGRYSIASEGVALCSCCTVTEQLEQEEGIGGWRTQSKPENTACN